MMSSFNATTIFKTRPQSVFVLKKDVRNKYKYPNIVLNTTENKKNNKTKHD